MIPQQSTTYCPICQKEQTGFILEDNTFVCPGCSPKDDFKEALDQFESAEVQHQTDLDVELLKNQRLLEEKQKIRQQRYRNQVQARDDLPGDLAEPESKPDVSEILSLITDAASSRNTVKLVYNRSKDQAAPEREVEPYLVVQGEKDLMLRAYQLTPDTGWRFFMLSKVNSVQPGNPFSPRKKITLTSGTIQQPFELKKDPVVNGYFDLVANALADMRVDDAERKRLEAYREESGIGPEQMRAVHYTIFMTYLRVILDDGLISGDEVDQLQQLNELLTACGAGVIGK